MIIKYATPDGVQQVYSPAEETVEEVIDLMAARRTNRERVWFTFPTEVGTMAIPMSSVVSIEDHFVRESPKQSPYWGVPALETER